VNSNPGVNAIVLTGGSAFGLDAATGAMRWLEEQGQGVRVGPGDHDVVPIVPTAVIFDLGRGGGFQARPEHTWGREAIGAAGNGPVAEGNRGAGAGARAGRLKGGVGSASVRLPDGTTVGALVVVNAVGSTVDAQGRLYGERYGLPGEFPELRTPVEPPPEVQGSIPGMNTVIAVVATDVALDKAAARRMAMVAHDGLARSIDPIHTLVDGDTIFAASTGATRGAPRLSVTDPAALAQLETVFAAGARTLSRAIVRAVLAAESVGTPAGELISYRDAYPSAFATS
jgi:L-aminopeptidase/D-esterase-like protein